MSAAALSRLAAALAAGLVFGLGLSLSGMIDPARVLGFLDLASGHWDPSLVFVLAGAVMVAAPGIALQRRLSKPLLDEQFHLPPPGGGRPAPARRRGGFWYRLGACRLLPRPRRRGIVAGAGAGSAVRGGDAGGHAGA